VFNITGEMKVKARRAGEDIIDFGMGNPDGATPKHIVDKLVEAALKPATHRYSVSRGLPRLRKAICNWYKTRYNVDLDPETEPLSPSGQRKALRTSASPFSTHGTRCWCQPQLSDSYLRTGDCRSARGERAGTRP